MFDCKRIKDVERTNRFLNNQLLKSENYIKRLKCRIDTLEDKLKNKNVETVSKTYIYSIY